MGLPTVVSREEWLTARKALLAKEKELTYARDALNAERRELPMVKVEKDYLFDGPGVKASLLELFDSRRQLFVYNYMFGADWDEGCPGCSFLVDSIGPLVHLHARYTSLVVISRAPSAKLAAFKERMGWTFPWYSSGGTDFNEDFGATVDGGEVPIVNVFLRDGEDVFHTYQTENRGTELLDGTYNYLDMTPLGRQEEGLQPPMSWVRLHDRYENV